MLAGFGHHAVITPSPPALPFWERFPSLAAIHTDDADLFKITVCTRPFRAQGPRIEAETLSFGGGRDKLVVHNYGHGGSGWSLSWGSGRIAVDLALASRDPSKTDLAVIGCGALGLTSALIAQRSGVRSVTIYTRDLPSDSRSFRATGSWTPDSRVALARNAPVAFPAQWEQMARTSWQQFQALLHSPGEHVEMTERYTLSDFHPDLLEQASLAQDLPGFAHYMDRISDLNPHLQDFPAGSHPFPTRWVRRRNDLQFNITSYVQQLTQDFQLNGGTIVQREFHTPAEFAALPEPVILHSTGYAARALFSDDSVTPVRGQIGWLKPQPEINYGLYYGNLNTLSRRDGMVVQLNPLGDASGWNDASEAPDHDETAEGLETLRSLFRRMVKRP